MVSVADCTLLPKIESSLMLPQPLTRYNKAPTTTKPGKSNKIMSTTSTPPLTILEPATPPQSQPTELQSPPVSTASRLTDFSIAAILGNRTSAITASTPSSALGNQTFTTIQNSPLLAPTSTYCDTKPLNATNEQSSTKNQPINQDNDHQQLQPLQESQKQKQASCKRIRPKKYQCPYCWVALSNTGQFKGHIRIHTGERPFICECGKSFTRNEELTRHKRIHTGLRPYSCPICNKCFGRKDHLKKHARTHEKSEVKLEESGANLAEDESTTTTGGGVTGNGGGGGGGAISSGSSSTSGSSCNGSSSNYSDHSAMSSPQQQLAPNNFDISGYLSAMNLFSNMMANTPRYPY